MDINTMVILGLCIIILIILVIMYIKDKQVDKKFERFDQVLTDNMQENFIIKKHLEELLQGGESREISDLADIIDTQIEKKFAGISSHIDKEIEEKISPALQSIKAIDELIRKNYQ